jgi:aspartate carbamoyltransferase catalytic subunit
MALRVQRERHGADTMIAGSAEEYHRDFGLTTKRLQILDKNAIIMHPGTVNYGVELCHEVISDRRNRILQQVANGVLIRASLLELLLHEGEAKK